MTTAQMIAKATELDSAADMLDSALLAPSLKSQTLRQQAGDLRAQAHQAQQEEAAAEYGRLARSV